MGDYASSHRQPGRRLVGMGLVVVLHLLIFWAVNSGLARTLVKKVQGPVEAMLLEEPRPNIPLPPPPPPPATPPPKNLPPPAAQPAFVPPVEVPVAAPAPAQAIAAVTSAPTPPATPAPPSPPAPPAPAPAPVVKAEPVRTAAVVSAGNCEKPEYPSASRRLEEEGTVFLRFLVGVDGKVIQSEVEKSSGHRRLDEAARAGLSRCQFRPATVDGKPEQAWASMKYTWRLE